MAGPSTAIGHVDISSLQLGPPLSPATTNGQSIQATHKENEQERANIGESKLQSNGGNVSIKPPNTTAQEPLELLEGQNTLASDRRPPSTIRAVPQQLFTDTDEVEMISPTPVRIPKGTSILNDNHNAARDHSRSGSTSASSSVILITSSPNPVHSQHQPVTKHATGNSQNLGVPSSIPRGLPQPVGSMPLSSESRRSVSPNPSFHSQTSRRSSFSFSLSMGNGGREKTPSPGPDSIEGLPGNGGDAKQPPQHGRKSSISRTIAGALIPGWATGSSSYRDDSKEKNATKLAPNAGIKRGKSPSLSSRRSMDWGAASDASTAVGGNSRMSRIPSTSSVNTLATNYEVGKSPSVAGTSSATVPPPPIAAKPGWLRRTASGNKMLAGLGLGSFTSSSSLSLGSGSHGSSPPAAPSRNLQGVAEAEDEPPMPKSKHGEMGPPSLPTRKKPNQSSQEQKVPTLPPRKPASSAKSGSKQSSAASADPPLQRTSSRLSIASALDFRRPKSPGKMPETTPASTSVPVAPQGTPDPAPADQARPSAGSLPQFSKSLNEDTLLSRSRVDHDAALNNVGSSGLSRSHDNGLLPPPMPQRAAQSMDVPRRVALSSGHASSAGSISGLNSLQASSRNGRGGANRKWTSTSGHAADAHPSGLLPRTLEGIAFPTSNSSSSFLQAAPGAIGTAVSTGWAALRSTRSSLSFPHSSSNLAFPRSGSTNTSDSSWIRVDGNGHDAGIPPPASSRTGLGYEGPKLVPETILRRPRPGQEDAKLAFGKELEEAARACPVEDLPEVETDNERRRKNRKRCLPAVAVRCVDHLCIWAPQEEGIFRISGRSTHITQLRKQFDAGADIALELCDPGDVDPHAVASLYRSYLRELPLPILTDDVMPKYNRLIDGHTAGVQAPSSATNTSRNELLQAQRAGTGDLPFQHKRELIAGMAEVLESLSDSSWWLLNDLSRILALTSQHSQVNKMTIQNLLTVFSPSLKISMTFLKLLVEHHDSIFINEEKPATLADRRGNDKRLSLMPDILLTRDRDSISSPLGESTKVNAIDPPRSSSDHHDDGTSTSHSTSNNTLQPSPVSDKGRFSTPIADKFARSGPVNISFREPSPHIETAQNQ
ncbi:hypothetical protein QFC21_005843 [Naganishia friedmannii]|uniref:Uncharacterized protein n=1 Tax=Naganishia friedmannii TaxID=89922 RepID=A0ACC2V6L1_9TREE|nr:hypothetical protein QFC21_005843 [Naganishia friedmannii]